MTQKSISLNVILRYGKRRLTTAFKTILLVLTKGHYNVPSYSFSYYKYFLKLMTDANFKFYSVKDFLLSYRKNEVHQKSVILRHDVDVNPLNALKLAQIEKRYDVTSTYYFRLRSQFYKFNHTTAKIIRKIYALGFEIGYHYECYTLHNGNKSLAIKEFTKSLEKLRQIVPIYTICAHGARKDMNNYEMWENTDELKKYNLIGEAFLSILFNEEIRKNLVYISDSFNGWEQKLKDFIERNLNAQNTPILYINRHPYLFYSI